MSIKAYEAYKYIGTPAKLIPTLITWKERLYQRLVYCHSVLLPTTSDNITDAWYKLCELAKETSIKSERSPFDYEIGLRIFYGRNTTVIVPNYEIMNRAANLSMEFLKKEPTLREFSYWDNSDKPNHISKKEWAARAKVYDKIDKPIYVSWMNHSSMYLTLPLFGEKGEFVKGFKDALH